jgi:phage repressor protein C with HTH and peptisase S24 domain
LEIDPKRLIPDLAPSATLIPEREVRGQVEDLPVHVATEGGPGEIIVSTDPIAWVLRPAPLASVTGAYGIIVVGESMIPEFEPGDIALVNPHLPAVGGHTYVFYAEGDGETRATIKRLLRASNGLWHVKQWNPARGQKAEFTLSRKEWGKAHRVVSKNYK